ncbi:MlaD family protein [Nocardia goodfellowii]|uniref:Virulence factor Mce-like protein n=1 Tax=Nocardia goodfellowii TaxID=882446 RepID=A0ABS4QQZ7_9NOCA|nr:MCE family protein [Nocardia goodfellowii]MBP2193076.1 virulence factor Mce-like protein [Nocardia goodfellowii]
MLLDPSGRGPTARQLTLAGLAMLTAIAGALYLLALRYDGRFEAKVPVTAVLTSTGDGLPENADVKFRGMIVGRVDAVDIVAKGDQQRAAIWLRPGIASAIPANVAARVIPNNLFGVTAIELVDTGPTTQTLRAGATIAEDTSATTVQLQTTLNVLRNVLNNIQPEKLGRVLATLAAALDPAARVPGSTIERLDHWMTEVRALPAMADLLGDLGRAATALSQSAPELVGVLSESVTTAKTLTEERASLIAMLTSGGAAVDTVNSLFAANPDSGKFLVSGLNELFGSLAKDTEAIPFAISNLNTALQRLLPVFTFGSSRQMAWKMDVSFTPFQQYTAKDCPRYGDVAGPRCGGASVPEVAPEQQYPQQMLPQHLASAGPAPVLAPGVLGIPGAPAVPGLPSLPMVPGLPVIPGITAPAAQTTPTTPNGTAGPIALRGNAAVAAVVGGEPTMAQLLLLGPALHGGYIEIADVPTTVSEK